ncbi:hypothetical protein BGX24_010491 [Mortierella sp. AD032]|nr:hypothetical protein BGX24_010491 [Mortierella sp. AD032]
MRISWALQVAAVFCLVAVHPAVADSSINDNNNNKKHIEPIDPILYRRAVQFETIENADHIVNYARMGGLQFGRRGAPASDEHERPRPRPGPSRSQHTDVPAEGEPHLEHEPRRRRPTDLKPPGDNHHPKPTPHKPSKPDHGKPPKKPDHGKPGKPGIPSQLTNQPTSPSLPSPRSLTTAPTSSPVAPPPPPPPPPSPVAPSPTVAPVAPVVPPTAVPGTPGQDLPSGNNPGGSPNAQPTTGLNANSGGSMSGSSSSSMGTIIGAVVGSVALAGLVALGVYRRRERQRAVEEATGPNPEMDEAPRTAFRHESFMALVKDAAQGFYAPGTTSPTPGAGGPGPSGLSTVAVAAGAGTGGSSLSRQTSARSQNSQHSLHSRRSGQFSAHGMTPSSPPPLAHIGGR